MYARVRDMLAADLDDGRARCEDMYGYAGVSVAGGLFKMEGNCANIVFGNSIKICVPYSSENKDGIDALLQFFLETECSGDESSH